MIQERTITAEGRKMNCISFGKGKKTMLLISGLNVQDVRGLSVALGLWWLYRGFAKEYTLYCFDRREDLPEGCTVREMAEDIALGMKALGLKDACVLGVSQGGMIAQYLAIDHPELVRKLVLGVTLSRRNDTLARHIERWCALAEAGDKEGILLDYLQENYSAAYQERYRILLPLLAGFTKTMPLSRFLICAQACLSCESYELLEKISCPVLVLGGKEDKIVTPEASAEIAGKLNCEVYLYENGGHAVYEEEAKDFNRRVRDFFAREEY
ncbi:MAG: alpha/beta hydrolase [Erysipelotrichaceae bacterium]|nr:alpha/beta hydrolase [Erysipelotrichaceae bacterium]